ncbi:MAG: Cdc6/Cdc18 family protein [Promethearchaeota archaeon]
MNRVNPFDGKTVFKDASTFDHGWIPSLNDAQNSLPCRETEINSLSAFYRPVINSNFKLCLNSLILGKGGVGKTVTSKYFGRIFRDAAQKAKKFGFLAEYIDCNDYSTRNSILREVLSKLKISTGRGYSDPELMKQLIYHIKNNNGYLFLVLDEVHKLEPDDLLSFLNSSISFGTHNVFMSFLCVSRSYDWLKYSTERLTSRIQKVYTFKPYLEKDAFEILRFRNKLAFYSGTFSDEILHMIAKISEKEKNMRIGIELLRRVALHLDENFLTEATPEMIREAGGNIISNYDTNLLNYLTSGQDYIILLSIARYFKSNSGNSYITSSDIYTQYKIVCDEYEHFSSLKFPTLKRYVKKIEDLGIISKTFALPDGKERGRESRYSLIEFQAEKLEEQLTKMLDNLYKD